LLAVLLLVYVGIEIGLGAWAFTYGREAAGVSATAAALLSSGFWCALTLGRLASPPALQRLAPETLLVVGPLTAAAGSLALVLAGDVPAVLVLGVLLAGFGFGPVWPVTFALAARAYPTAAGSASGLLAMIAAAGGLVLPWLQGAIIAGVGPTAGIAVTLAGCLAVAALAAAVARTERRASSAATTRNYATPEPATEEPA
jgi:fucose permease